MYAEHDKEKVKSAKYQKCVSVALFTKLRSAQGKQQQIAHISSANENTGLAMCASDEARKGWVGPEPMGSQRFLA